LAVETFTFLFTDIEDSTALVRRLGEGLYAQLLADHHSLIRSGLAAHDGREVDTRGMRSSRCFPHRGRVWRP
jgi:class 3 adenylate cyclase